METGLNANGHPYHDEIKDQSRQHLEAIDLDDDDAFPRIAFDAYAAVTGQTHTFDDNVYKDGWRAAAAAVRAATLLQQANRATADT